MIGSWSVRPACVKLISPYNLLATCDVTSSMIIGFFSVCLAFEGARAQPPVSGGPLTDESGGAARRPRRIGDRLFVYNRHRHLDI